MTKEQKEISIISYAAENKIKDETELMIWSIKNYCYEEYKRVKKITKDIIKWNKKYE